MKTTPLLTKILRSFSIYAFLVLLLSIPAYFWIIDSIWQAELDKHNKAILKKLEKQLDQMALKDEEALQFVQLWNAAQPHTQLMPMHLDFKQKDSLYTFVDKDQERYRVLSSMVFIGGQPYAFSTRTNLEEWNETLAILAVATLVFFFLLLFGFIILNRQLAKKIWQPFGITLQTLQNFDLRGKTLPHFASTPIREFAHLHQSLKKLLEKNVAIFLQQKEFTENASHELQTPLALMQSQVDQLLQAENLSPEQAELLEALDFSLSRISRINKNLLLLAKIDNQEFIEKEEIDVSALLEKDIQLLSEHFVAQDLRLNTEIAKNIKISANLTLLEVLITNLLINTLRHSPKGALVEVFLNDKNLIVQNSGTSALQRDALFQRFRGSSLEKPSSGLGLALVKRICELHQFEIEYHFEKGMHRFNISFR